MQPNMPVVSSQYSQTCLLFPRNAAKHACCFLFNADFEYFSQNFTQLYVGIYLQPFLALNFYINPEAPHIQLAFQRNQSVCLSCNSLKSPSFATIAQAVWGEPNHGLYTKLKTSNRENHYHKKKEKMTRKIEF